MTPTFPYRLDAFAIILLAIGAIALAADREAGSVALPLAVVVSAGWLGGPRAGIITAAIAAVVAPLISRELRQFDVWAVFVVAAGVAAATSAAVRRRVDAMRRGYEPQPAIETPPPADPDREAGALGRAAMYIGLPLLAAVVYLNLSDLIARRTPVPSILQPLIALLLIAAVAERRALSPRTVVSTAVALFMFVWGVVLLMRSAWASDPAGANARLEEAFRGLIILIVAGTLAATFRALDRAVTVLAFSAALLAILTIVQTATGRWDIDFGGLARSERAHLYGDLTNVRPGGPLGDPNFYGQILVMAIPLALVAGWRDRRHRRGIVLLGCGTLAVIGTLLTYSRGAMLALAFVLLLTAIALRVRVTWIAATAVLAMLLLPASVTNRFLSIVRPEPGTIEGVRVESSLEGRRLDAASALLMFNDHPFFGVGTGSFSYNHTRYANLAGSSAPYYEMGPTRVPHSLYLEIAAETGFLGLIAFGAAMAVAFTGLAKAKRRLLQAGREDVAAIATALTIALAGYLVSSIFLHGAFQRYLWLLLGLIVAVIRLSRRDTAAAEIQP